MSDVKTLRLASAQLTAESLEAFLTYQRTLLSALAASGDAQHATWAGRFAFAHGTALAESGLDALTQQRLKVLVSEFCGKRSAWLTVKQRAADAEAAVHQAKAHGRPVPEKEALILSRASAELHRLEDFSPFAARYGPEALELLRGRDLEVVTLHRELSRLEGSGGHLHPG
ncbi:MAG: hypothetical protein JNJ54_23370 [Myxococcaceae bacterium]|nr:hypothetical protein [Myxococcaceae bacterium]